MAVVDFHNHLIPGVDDGASTLEESRAALQQLAAEDVTAIITTPHVDGSLTNRPEKLAKRLAQLDRAWAELQALGAREYPELRLDRGAEVMLDTPAPDLSDGRLRLAGTPFVLVEFPGTTVPPHSASALFDLKMKGWTPVIAHPERYSGVGESLRVIEEWCRVGTLLQVNGASLTGRYGRRAQETACRLLARGWVSYVSSDYHARGGCGVAAARETLVARGGAEQARLLLEVNPGLLLHGEPPEPVPPLAAPRRSLWRWLPGSGRS